MPSRTPRAFAAASEQRDRRLTDILKEERDGILGWMIEGCAAWQRAGLAPPVKVSEAAESYIADEDLVGQWIEECCNLDPRRRERAAALFGSWISWAKARGFEIGSQKTLGEALRARSLSSVKVNGARGWSGIALRRAPPSGEAD